MFKNVLRKTVSWAIRMLLIAKNKLLKDSSNPYSFDDLTPIDDIENGEAYCMALDWALKNNNIKNIAITGPYGSGKSSVIKTFEKQHPEHKYLNITLGTFKDGLNDPKPESNEQDENSDEHRLVEISILQQMFYKVKASSIPDSRFKRIKSLKKPQIILYTGLIIAMFLSVLILFIPDVLVKFPWWQSFRNKYENFILYIAGGLLLTGIIVLVLYLIRFFNAKQFDKLNITSGEIKIHSDNEKSILNKHLDEILYFFEVTEYNVIVIEDLDRFKNPEIFTKLRELNFLVNNSKQINRRIVFIYAIKDDMFQDKTRTKFFDFIIPVIPIINSSNSLSILLKKLENPSLNLSVDQHFIGDITLYIDDMRILKNIFNEFIIYKENLKSLSINHNKLLGIIIYKNIYPNDFADLHENKGIVYEVFGQLKAAKAKELDNLNKKTSELESVINKANNTLLNNVEELNAVYLLKLLELHPNAKFLSINGNKHNFADVKKDNIFSIFKEQKNIQIYINDYSQSNIGKSFADIEKSVDPNESYNERVKSVENKNNSKLQELRKRLEQLNQQKSQINSYSLKEFLDAFPEGISLFEEKFLKKELLLYLMRYGYIDEMYTSLTSYFYEGSVTKNDMDYLMSIKNKKGLDFNLPLSKIDEVVRRITLTELKADDVLNFYFVTFLLQKKQAYNNEFMSLFSQFMNKTNRQLEFIYAYLNQGPEQGLFTAAICDSWKGFWETIASNNSLTTEMKDKILRLIIIHSDIDGVSKLDINSSLSYYISGNSKFLSLVPEEEYIERVKVGMDSLDIQFKELFISEVNMPLFDYVYANNYYEINPAMVSLIVRTKGGNSNPNEELEKSNYSAIINSGCEDLLDYVEDEIDLYISNVFLKLEKNIDEPEEILKKLLNNERITLDNRKLIVEKEKNLITDITQIPFDLWDGIIRSEKIECNWNILLEYYLKVEKIDDTLAGYINKKENYLKLSDSFIGFDNENKENFSKALILNPLITDDCFEKIVKSIKYGYDDGLDVESFSIRKIVTLVKNKTLLLSVPNFNSLKKLGSQHLLLITDNIDEFIANQHDYLLESNDLISLLKSNEIALSQKLQIIGNISEELINSQDGLADVICFLLSKDNSTEISYEKLIKIMLYSKGSDNRLLLFINKLQGLSSEQIDGLLGAMGEPYNVIAERGKRHTIPNSSEHLELVRKLQEVDYISSFKIEYEDKRIRINAKVS